VQIDRDIRECAAGEIYDGAGERFVERCDAHPKRFTPRRSPRHGRAPRPTRARSPQLCGDRPLQVALAGERQVEARVAAKRIEEMVEEADAGLHGGLPVPSNRALRESMFREWPGHSRSPRGSAHGSNSSRSATSSSTRAAPASATAAAVKERSSLGQQRRAARRPRGSGPHVIWRVADHPRAPHAEARERKADRRGIRFARSVLHANHRLE